MRRPKLLEAAIAAHETDTSDADWDAATVTDAIPEDATAADLESVYAWVDDEGDPAIKASYKFPHHEGVDGAAVLAACSAGIAALNGGRGGADIPDADREGVHAHLAAHLEAADAEVPELADAAPPEPATEADLGLSANDRNTMLCQAIDEMLGIPDDAMWDERPWIRDVFDASVVYSYEGASWMVDYSIEGTNATLGEPTEVRVSYEPVGTAPEPPAAPPAAGAEAGGTRRGRRRESAGGPAGFNPRHRPSLESLAAAMLADARFAHEVAETATKLQGDELPGGFVAISESAVREDGTALIKLIQPGWGSSGYYSDDLLEADGPKAFGKGTKMYWNHQTEAQEYERPEGDLRDLAGELLEDARWLPEGPDGKGLYAQAKVFSEFSDRVNELAPHIGVSIRAYGKASEGEAEGQSGTIIDSLSWGQSVDYVTEPGAGGKVLELFESAGRRREGNMESKELTEAKAQTQRAREALAVRDAKDIVTKALGESELPEPTRKRLVESLSGNVELTDKGELDTEALATAVTEAIETEAAYLTELGAGSVRGMGHSSAATTDVTAQREELAEGLQGLGLSESAAKAAATGR
jgi:hypothetical protein